MIDQFVIGDKPTTEELIKKAHKVLHQGPTQLSFTPG